MAFNGIQHWNPGNAVVYALNLNGLGVLWQKYTNDPNSFDRFRWSERAELFKDEYPVGILQLVEFPTSWNTRMLRQIGLFVYDFLQYTTSIGFTDLKISSSKELILPIPPATPPSLCTRFLVPYSAASEIFERLELMGITVRDYTIIMKAQLQTYAIRMFSTEKTGFVHDIIVPPENP